MYRRSSLVYPVTHLPLLHNPLLNALFNHPNPTKSRLYKTTKQLSDHPNRYIILLPDSQSLQEYQDLCHDEQFVQSHIVQEVNNVTYVSMNNKSYTFTNNHIVIPGTSVKIKMTSNELFTNFNNYMNDKCLYKVIHILSPIEVPSNNNITQDIEDHDNQDVEFNQLIREFPLISERIGDIYRHFFTKLNLKELHSLERLVESYNSIISSGNSIFVDNLDKDSVASILEKYPNLDINRSLFNYIEMNIYDKVWAQLCHVNQERDAMLNKSFKDLQDISLNQVEIPGYADMTIEEITSTEKCINKSKAELESLNFTNGSELQCKALVSVFQILANNSHVGADTLIGLLIVTICRSKVPNLNSHLKYIEFFSYDNQNYEKGYLGYVISTFSAVLDYINDSKHLENLKTYSLANRNCWNLFQETNEYIYTIAELQDLLRSNSQTEVPIESVLYSRNEEGQSLLFLLIKSGNFNIFRTVLDYETIYPIEDLLKDRNINNLTLLGQAILMDNTDMIDELISVILSSTTEQEKYQYFNSCDDNQRNIGHILFDITLLKEIGPYINWKQRDINSQTPFFTMLRCYDHPNYSELVSTVIEIVVKWYSANNLKFDYRDHNDAKNNTLLHVIKCNLSQLLKSFTNLNLNELNHRNFTPLMYYIKYNRSENVRDILQDDRLDIAKYDVKNYWTALDYAKIDMKKLIRNHENGDTKSKKETVSKVIKDDKIAREIELMVDQTYIRGSFPTVGGLCFGITRMRADNNNNEVCIFFKTMHKTEEEQWCSNIHSLRDYIKLLQLLKMENPHLLLSSEFVGMIPMFPNQILKINNFYRYQLQNLSVLLNMTNQLILSDCSESQILHDFLLKPGNINEKKVLHKIKQQAMENSIEKPISGELMDEEVVAMRHFLNYSLDQLVEFEMNHNNFAKMLTFVNIKIDETEYVHSQLLQSFKFNDPTMVSQNCVMLANDLRKILAESNQKSNNFKFLAGHKLILFMCQELIASIRKLLSNDLVIWEDLNKNVSRLDSEIRRLQIIDGKQLPQSPVKRKPSHIVLGDSSTDSAMDSSSLVSEVPSSASSNSFLFSSIVQTRKSRDLKIERLTEKKMSLIDKLESMGNELRSEHESIALKLNNFLSFKKKFTTLQFKMYTESVIRDMKFRLRLLEK